MVFLIHYIYIPNRWKGNENENEEQLEDFERCKPVRMKSNKNIFGNLYINSVGNVSVNNESNLDSGFVLYGL